MKIRLTILKEDILLDNYMDSNHCPITKALIRAGYTELCDKGMIQGTINGKEVNLSGSNNVSYRDLLMKLSGMYNSFTRYGLMHVGEKPEQDTPEAEEPETFTHVLEFDF